MEIVTISMRKLFAQLGEANDDLSISRFIQNHGKLAGGTHVHEAPCWTAAQADFLKEALAADAAWAPVVDELNTRLHCPDTA